MAALVPTTDRQIVFLHDLDDGSFTQDGDLVSVKQTVVTTNPDGSLLITNPDGTTATAGAPTVDTDTTYTFSQPVAGGDVTVQAQDADGNNVGAPFVITHTAAVQDTDTTYQFAQDPDNNLVIQAQDIDGNNVGTPINLAATQDTDTIPSALALDAATNTLTLSRTDVDGTALADLTADLTSLVAPSTYDAATRTVTTSDANSIIIPSVNSTTGVISDGNGEVVFPATAAHIRSGTVVGTDNRYVNPLRLREAIEGYDASLNYAIAVHTGIYLGRAGTANDSTVAVGKDAGRNQAETNIVAVGTNAALNNAGPNSTFVGWSAGENNTSLQVTGLGATAARGNTGDAVTAVGNGAAEVNTGVDVTALGWRAGRFNTGGRSTFVGTSAGENHGAAADCVGVGFQSLLNNTATQSTALGLNSGSNNTFVNTTHIGFNAQATQDNEIQLGNLVTVNVNTAGTYTGTGFVNVCDESTKRNIREPSDIEQEAAKELAQWYVSSGFRMYDRILEDGDREEAFVVAQHVRAKTEELGEFGYVVIDAPSGDLHVDLVSFLSIISYGQGLLINKLLASA